MGDRIFTVAFLDLAFSLVHFNENNWGKKQLYRNHNGTAAKTASFILWEGGQFVLIMWVYYKHRHPIKIVNILK